MNDMDISGQNSSVSLRFENAVVTGSRKLMQKVMLWLVQDNSTTSTYGTGFYSAVRRSNASAAEAIQGKLDIALTNIRGNLEVVRAADEPVVDELIGTVYNDSTLPDKVRIEVSMVLDNGDAEVSTLDI